MHAIDPHFFWSLTHNIVEMSHVFEQMNESVTAIAKTITVIAHHALIVALAVSIIWLAIYGWNYWQEKRRASQTIYQNQGYPNPTIDQIRDCLRREAGEDHHWQRCPKLSQLPYEGAFYQKEFVVAAIDHQVERDVVHGGFVVRVDGVAMNSVAALRQAFLQRFEYRFPPIEWIRKKVYGDSVSELLCYCQQGLFVDVMKLMDAKLLDDPSGGMDKSVTVRTCMAHQTQAPITEINIALDRGEESIFASRKFEVVDDTKLPNRPILANVSAFVNVDLINKVNWIGYTIDEVF